MKKIYLFTIIVALFFQGCEKEKLLPKNEFETIEFIANTEVETKTILHGQESDDIRKIFWMPQDSIMLFYSRGVSKLVYNGIDTVAQAPFSGLAPTSSYYYSIYPYNAKNSINYQSQELTFYLPKVQEYRDKSFANNIFPMVASSTNTQLSFMNLCGVLEIRLKGSQSISSITFQSKDAKGAAIPVSGKAYVKMNYETVPTIVMDQVESFSSVKLDMTKSPIQLNVSLPKTFYIVLPPGTYNTFDLRIRDSNGYVMVKSGVKPLSIIRSNGCQAGQFSYVPTVIDLNIDGYANSYIVSNEGQYKFKADVIGNGSDGIIQGVGFHTTSSTISPLSAQLLWQDKENLITKVEFDKNNKTISFVASELKGNAVIAAYSDIEGKGSILWSWHIWLTDAPSIDGYYLGNVKYEMLDRNLGALRNNPGTTNEEKTESYGLLYQWGRKDPFPGTSSFNSDVERVLYGKVNAISLIGTNNSLGTINGSILNPTVFLVANQGAFGHVDWLISGRNGYLWGNPFGYDGTPYNIKKTIYDPCPPGYMVPPRYIWNNFTYNGVNSDDPGFFNVTALFSNGWHFYYQEFRKGKTTWYPACGYRPCIPGNIQYSGTLGSYWSSSPFSGTTDLDHSSGFHFNIGSVYPNSPRKGRADGSPIRCVKTTSIK